MASKSKYVGRQGISYEDCASMKLSRPKRGAQGVSGHSFRYSFGGSIFLGVSIGDAS